MKITTIPVNAHTIPVITLDTAIVGSGCAGFNAADWLYTLGRRDIAVLTEGVNMGTSRNTGSDKQTYYKLSLSGGEGDSVTAMAADLYSVQGKSIYFSRGTDYGKPTMEMRNGNKQTKRRVAKSSRPTATIWQPPAQTG